MMIMIYMTMMMIVLLHVACCGALRAAKSTHTCNLVRAGAHLNELEDLVRRQDKATSCMESRCHDVAICCCV